MLFSEKVYGSEVIIEAGVLGRRTGETRGILVGGVHDQHASPRALVLVDDKIEEVRLKHLRFQSNPFLR